MLNAIKSRHIHRCSPSFSRIFDVWVDKIVSSLGFLISRWPPPSPSIPPWPPSLYPNDHPHHQLHQHAHYHHYQHHYLFPYSQVKTSEITTTPAEHGTLGVEVWLVNVFNFHFSNPMIKSKSTRQRWHQPCYLQNQTIARTIMLLSMRPRFQKSRVYVNYVWQRALDTKRLPVSRKALSNCLTIQPLIGRHLFDSVP